LQSRQTASNAASLKVPVALLTLKRRWQNNGTARDVVKR